MDCGSPSFILAVRLASSDFHFSPAFYPANRVLLPLRLWFNQGDKEYSRRIRAAAHPINLRDSNKQRRTGHVPSGDHPCSDSPALV
jgi:hypothetical protein